MSGRIILSEKHVLLRTPTYFSLHALEIVLAMLRLMSWEENGENQKT